MGRKRRERTKPEEEGEARNGDSNPSPVPRTTRSPAQDLGAAVAAATVEERRGRQIWGRRGRRMGRVRICSVVGGGDGSGCAARVKGEEGDGSDVGGEGEGPRPPGR